MHPGVKSLTWENTGLPIFHAGSEIFLDMRSVNAYRWCTLPGFGHRHRRKRLPFILLCILSAILFSLTCHAWYEDAEPLFVIARSKNANVVQYSVRPDPDGSLSGNAPVYAYWILADGEEKDLNGIQKLLAYGIDSQRRLGPEQYEIALAAAKEKRIVVRKTLDGYKAFALIDGTWCILDRVYIAARENLVGFPCVQYVELCGRDERSNRSVTERLVP
jgi:hypothetical protein